jgi:hypothetical protein
MASKKALVASATRRGSGRESNPVVDYPPPMRLTLPPPAELARRARLIAFLDTLLEPDFALRYFNWDPAWGADERLFSMRSGEGDHAFAWFGTAGCLVRGKHRRKKAVPDGKLFAGLPCSLETVRDEAAFQLGGDSFAMWCPKGRKEWQWAVAPGAGGANEPLRVLDGDPKSFAKYARAYHEIEISRAALASFYDSGTVTAPWLAELSDAIDAARAFEVARDLGVPTQGKAPEMAKRSTKRASPDEPEERMGDGEFKVVRLGDETMLVVGGRVQLKAKRAGLYYEVIERVRELLRAAGATGP